MSHLIAIVAFIALLVSVALASVPDAMPDTWDAVDALGRKVATRGEAPALCRRTIAFCVSQSIARDLRSNRRTRTYRWAQ